MNDNISDRARADRAGLDDGLDSTPSPRASRLPGAAFGRVASSTDDRGPRSRIARSMLATVPIMVVGSMAIGLGMTGPVASASLDAHPTKKPHAAPRPVLPAPTAAPVEAPEPATVDVAASTARALAPSTYTVVAGDSVASIAGSFGLSTASVLALNGLSWKSTIFPGQTLSLVASSPRPAAPSTSPSPSAARSGSYVIARGDTLSSIAGAHGVSTQALLGANGLAWSSIIYPGQTLRIPGGAAAPASSAPAPSASTASTSHTIRSGETIASIAAQRGVTVRALLGANGLTMTSTIYAGRTLVLPSRATASPAVVTTVATRSTPLGVGTTLTSEQEANARTIIRVGRDIGASDAAVVVALAAAAQESSLRNIAWGDRDSLGLFQQRPSTGWGTAAQLTDPVHATKLFFGGRTNPNAGTTRGLLDIRGWSSMSLTDAAQAVQISAHPTAYAKWEGPARSWLATLG